MAVLTLEDAPEKWLQTSHDRKEIAGNRSRHRARWRISASERAKPGSVLRQTLQRTRLFPHIRKIGVGEAHAMTRGVHLPETNDLLWLGIGKRTKEHAVD